MDEIDAALGASSWFICIHFLILSYPSLCGFPSENLLFWFTCMTDFKNVSIVGHYVKDRTKDAQFIIIRYVC